MSRASDASLRHDGDLLYLTDTAYFALVNQEASGQRKNRPDGLFLERLESFLEGQQKDIEAFANREQRPLGEIRKLVAIPHARYLFSLDTSLPQHKGNPQASNASHLPSIRSTLARLSNTLRMLHSASGIDSLLLVVSPHPTPPPIPSSNTTINPDFESHQNRSIPSESYEASWMGGTDLGKEFWMGLKGGGVNGARAFRVKCQMHREEELRSADLDAPTPMNPLNPLHPIFGRRSDPDGLPTTRMRSGDVKTELNAAVRHALRSTSGNPSAEMRWTKPTSLEELYNVRLVGWPAGVHMRNPSNNVLKDNRLLLDLLRSGSMKFIQRGSPEWNDSPATATHVNPTFTERTHLPIINSVSPTGENPSIASPRSPAIALLNSPTHAVDPAGIIEGSSQPLTHVSNGLCSPSPFPSTGAADGVRDISTSIAQPSLDTFTAAENIAPKRPIEDYPLEPAIQNAREVKRVKRAKRANLDSVGAVR